MATNTLLEIRHAWLKYIIWTNFLLLFIYKFLDWKFPDPQGVSNNPYVSAATFLFLLFWLILLLSLVFTFPHKRSLLVWGWLLFLVEFLAFALVPAQG